MQDEEITAGTYIHALWRTSVWIKCLTTRWSTTLNLFLRRRRSLRTIRRPIIWVLELLLFSSVGHQRVALYVGSNTTQNFAVPIYRKCVCFTCWPHRLSRSSCNGNHVHHCYDLFLLCSVCHLHFPLWTQSTCHLCLWVLVRNSIGLQNITTSLFIGAFAFNYPALIITCSVIHGFSLAVRLWTDSFTVSASGHRKVCISVWSVTVQTGRDCHYFLLPSRGKRTGSFWAIFMAGNILGNLCAYCIMRFLGLVGKSISLDGWMMDSPLCNLVGMDPFQLRSWH